MLPVAQRQMVLQRVMRVFPRVHLKMVTPV